MSQIPATTTIPLVVGMHRSGTSLLSRALTVFGFDHGDQLLINSDNAKGHWEDLDIIALNDQLLAAVERQWWSLAPIAAPQLQQLCEGPLFTRAQQLIQQRRQQHRGYGFKDPRTSVLLPFWNEVLRSLGLTPLLLICWRNPVAVARSLQARNGLQPTHGHYLWLTYNLALLAFACQTPIAHVVVNYQQLLNHSETELQRIARHLGLMLDAGEAALYRDAFVDASLDHSDHTLDVALPRVVDEVQQLLVQASKDPAVLRSEASRHQIEAWQQQSWEQHSLLLHCDAEHERANRASHDAAHANGELQLAQAELGSIYNGRSWALTRPLRDWNARWLAWRGQP